MDVTSNVSEGVSSKGIVNEDNFFDFAEDILKDLLANGYEGQRLINEFRKMKQTIPVAMDKLIGQAERETPSSMSKEEFKKQIGLQQ